MSRENITRTMEYTEVTAVFPNQETYNYYVKGVTTPVKEMKKLLKECDTLGVPDLILEVKREKRTMSLKDFIKLSKLIESEEV